MSAESLIPIPARGPASPHGRIPFGFTPRFFIALLLGLLWLIPAWWDRRFVTAMFLWDGVVVLAWALDLFRLPRPERLEIERIWKEPLSLGRRSTSTIGVHNVSGAPVRVDIVDETPVTLRETPPDLAMLALPGETSAAFGVQPQTRGRISLGRTFLRYRGSAGLAERWAVAPTAQTVRVMPDLVRARNDALYLIRSRQVDMEKRRRRQKGMGREFEALREYRQGDELRTVHWPATARRHQLITRTYQVERSQPVWIVLDAGRLLRTQVHDPVRGLFVSKLDYAVDAALALTQVAAQSGDRVGLLAYGRTVQQMVGLGRGAPHVRRVLDALADVRVEAAEADHTLAARTLLQKQSQRSLILWITDFAETATVPEVIEHAVLMTRRHLVLFTAISQPDLAALTQSVPDSEDEMYRLAAGIEFAERRAHLLRRLRDQGVMALDLEPGNLTTAVLDRYLEIKDRSLL